MVALAEVRETVPTPLDYRVQDMMVIMLPVDPDTGLMTMVPAYPQTISYDSDDLITWEDVAWQ